MRAIENGMIVEIYYYALPEWAWRWSSPIRVKVLSMPADVGDYFYLRTDIEEEYDLTYAQNPMDSNLGQIVQVPDEKTNTPPG